MRPNEVAEKLGVTPAHIFNMLARGELPRVKLGAVTMIPIEAVRDLLQGREVKAKRRAVREVAHGG
jgi:excisionase family DNA binding protein